MAMKYSIVRGSEGKAPDYSKLSKMDSSLRAGHAALIGGKADQAAGFYRAALRAGHTYRPDFWQNIALTIVLRNDQDALFAIIAARRAVALDPKNGGILRNLGSLLFRLDRFREAREWLQKSLEYEPRNWLAYLDLGQIAWIEGDAEASYRYYETAKELAPNTEQSQGLLHYYSSIPYLAAGDYEKGLELHEGRFAELGRTQVWDLGAPEWKGEELAGKHIMIHQDQGDGDTLQFCRFMPDLIKRGARVSMAVPARMMRLMRHVFPGVTAYELSGDLPRPDFHSPVMSYVRHLGRKLPAWDHPYIRPQMSGARPASYSIGIVWAPKTNVPDQQRKIPLDYLAELAEIPGVELYSLQMGLGEEFPRCGASMFIHDATEDIRDWYGTAQEMRRFDLIVSIDSAPAHLAGAMGLDVICLLPYRASWRWGMRENDRTPWYPTMRLLRQDEAGDWTLPMTRLKDIVRDAVAERAQAAE